MKKNADFGKSCCGLGRRSFFQKNLAVANVLRVYPRETLTTDTLLGSKRTKPSPQQERHPPREARFGPLLQLL